MNDLSDKTLQSQKNTKQQKLIISSSQAVTAATTRPISENEESKQSCDKKWRTFDDFDYRLEYQH